MPINPTEKTQGPVSTPDASDDGPLDPQLACLACLNEPEDPGPGCNMPYTARLQDAKCNKIIQCGFESQCFQGSRKAFLNCGLPCVTKGGVLTPDDPVLTLAQNLFQCLANGPCGDICFQSD
jgi:hypothetical protein